MTAPLFLSIGEAMVELSPAEGDQWRMGFAGDTLNTAWYMRTCLPTDWQVAYFTRLGTDPFSGRMLDFLTAHGIDASFIVQDPARNVGLYAISLKDGERSFTYWRGQSAARHLADDAPALAAAIARARVVYLSGITLAILPPDRREVLLDLVGAARSAGTETVFDPNIRPQLWESPAAMRDWLSRAAAVAGIALPSFDDEARHFGDGDIAACAARWIAGGAGEVAVKNAGGAIALAHGGGPVERIDVTAVRPVDSTGAGDSFNAGYLSARLAGLSPGDAAARGHALATLVVGRRGALVPMEDLAPFATSSDPSR